MSEQLKPCPMCGKAFSVVVCEDMPGLYTVACSGMKGGCGLHTLFTEKRETAIFWWNHRTPEIVRCGECRHKYKGHCSHGPMAAEVVSDDFGCTEGQRWGKEEANGM